MNKLFFLLSAQTLIQVFLITLSTYNILEHHLIYSFLIVGLGTASPFAFLWLAKDLEINKNFPSYIKFFSIFVLFTLYTSTCLTLLFLHIPPITIYELSIISYIKYIALSTLVTVVIVVYIMVWYTLPDRTSDLITKVTHPYLQEFIQIIISSHHPSAIHSFTDWMVDTIFHSTPIKRKILMVSIC